MSSQAKLTVRPLPHLDFVLGYPGIAASSQASRNAAHISGSIEVRLGSKGLRATWLRVELRKLESAPGGENWGELIGKGPIDIWTAKGGSGERETDANGQWELLKTADFPFKILIPEGLPPTCRLDKQCGVSYEVVASLCIKTAKGMFRKEDTTSIVQSMHPINIEKHELHSTWPVYNQSDVHAGENGLLRAKVHRTGTCFAPGDRVKVKIIVYSNRVEPAKLKSVAFSIKETVTFHGLKSSGKVPLTSNTPGSGQRASQTVETVSQKAKQVGKKLYKGDSLNYDLECVIPKTHSLLSISTAKHIEVSYTMRVYVDINKAPIVIDHIPMLMTTFPRAESVNLIRKIGFVEGLSERDLVIEEDDDETFGQVVSRSSSQRPPASRQVSYGGSSHASYQQPYSRGVQRRDTVMTNLSGPGMAGRGVPGQVFDYGNGIDPYYSGIGQPPRSAFAGPPSIYEGEEGALSPTERAALAHYQAVDYNAFASATGLSAPPAAPRSAFMSTLDDRRASNRQSAPVPMRDPLRQAEEEKERLFQRAREQAERNQQRIDEGRSRPQSQQPPSISRFPTSSNNNSRSGTPLIASSSFPPATTEAEEEKRRLYERARVEAETYQRGYKHGATFPEEEEGAGSSAPPRKQERRRDSDLFWLDRPSNSNQAAPLNASPALTRSPNPASFPSAEQEKKRLYEQAKAQTETHLQGQQGSSSSQQKPSNGATDSALSEKAQLAKFQAAKDAVALHQAQGSSGSQSQQRPQSMAPLSNAAAPSEKEQMKLYYAAKDRQAGAEQGPASSYNPVRHSMGPLSPKPTYATNFQNGANAGWQQGIPSPAYTPKPSNGDHTAASPSLPSIQALNLNSESFSPKIASANWLDDDFDTDGPSNPPPQIPPKLPKNSPRP
jgi:hypothetical protein